MNSFQNYKDRSFPTPVIIKRIGTVNGRPLVEVVEGECEHPTYVLAPGHDAITPI